MANCLQLILSQTLTKTTTTTTTSTTTSTTIRTTTRTRTRTGTSTTISTTTSTKSVDNCTTGYVDILDYPYPVARFSDGEWISGKGLPNPYIT